MARSAACQEFEVGTRPWTDCVEDAATGGGLMPWIVVIPLAVMVVGMAIGFLRQFSAAGRRRSAAHGASGVAGSWLIFVAFVELAIGIGSFVAAQRAGDSSGFSISASVLLGVGILLLVIGIFLKIKGRRRARIYHSGLPGQATIRDVRETGMMVNNQPMYEFDLDVEGPGFAPATTTHREVVPLWMASRVGPQTKVPVKVDPSNPSRLIFDWDGVRAMAAAAAPIVSSFAGGTTSPQTQAATPADAQGFSIGDMSGAVEAARQMAGTGSGWHVGKAIGAFVVLLVIAIVGGGLWFFASIFRTVSDATSEVTDQVNEAIEEAGDATAGIGRAQAGTTIEVARAAEGRAPVGFSVMLPISWMDVTRSVEEMQGSVVVDLVMKPQPPSEARIVVTRSLRYLEDPAPREADVASVRSTIADELGDSVVRARTVRLSGEKAVAFDLAPGADGLRSRQIALMRGGQVLFVALTAPAREFEAALTVFQDVLASWQWSTVSAR